MAGFEEQISGFEEKHKILLYAGLGIVGLVAVLSALKSGSNNANSGTQSNGNLPTYSGGSSGGSSAVSTPTDNTVSQLGVYLNYQQGLANIQEQAAILQTSLTTQQAQDSAVIYKSELAANTQATMNINDDTSNNVIRQGHNAAQDTVFIGNNAARNSTDVIKAVIPVQNAETVNAIKVINAQTAASNNALYSPEGNINGVKYLTNGGTKTPVQSPTLFINNTPIDGSHLTVFQQNAANLATTLRNLSAKVAK